MLLRTASAAASSDSTKAHARLVSGQSNRYSSINARGTCVRCRMIGEMLDRKIIAAKTPTSDPKKVGTQCSVEAGGGIGLGVLPIPGPASGGETETSDVT